MNFSIKDRINKTGIINKEVKGKAVAIERTAREFQRLAEPYVPRSNNHSVHMADTARLSPFEKGEIVYNTTYASAVYNRDNATTHWTTTGTMSHWGDYVKEKYLYQLKNTFQRALNGEM